MNKLLIPATILFLQIIGFAFMFFISKKAPPDAPVGLVLIHLLAVFNLIVLIASYFLYFNSENKTHLWLIPIAIAVINIVIVIVMQILMAIGKL